MTRHPGLGRHLRRPVPQPRGVFTGISRAEERRHRRERRLRRGSLESRALEYNGRHRDGYGQRSRLPDHPRQGPVRRDGSLLHHPQLPHLRPWHLHHEVCRVCPGSYRRSAAPAQGIRREPEGRRVNLSEDRSQKEEGRSFSDNQKNPVSDGGIFYYYPKINWIFVPKIWGFVPKILVFLKIVRNFSKKFWKRIFIIFSFSTN